MCLLCIALPGPRRLVVFLSFAPSSRNTVSSKAWNVFSLSCPLCFFVSFCLIMNLAQHLPPHLPTQFPDRHTHSISIFRPAFALLLRICLKSLSHLYSSSVSPCWLCYSLRLNIMHAFMTFVIEAIFTFSLSPLGCATEIRPASSSPSFDLLADNLTSDTSQANYNARNPSCSIFFFNLSF